MIKISSICTALAAGALAFFSLSTAAAVTGKICLDPGHGGADSGGTGNGQQEKVNVLATSAKVKTWLDADTTDAAGGGSWTVIQTRTTDVFVELSGRTSFANSNGANRFVCIHQNAFDTTAHGIETFCYGSGSATSFDLRDKIHAEAILAWPLTDRGNKTANFYVLVNTSMPAELHEMAFIDNAGDSVYCGSSTQQDIHAKSELYGIQRNYGLTKYTPNSSAVVIADNGTAAWSASGNWGTSTNVAGYYGASYSPRATASVADAATWTVNLPVTASYKVEAWWTAATDRSTTSPYIVDASSGSVTVPKNQQANGGSWQNLGTFSFNAGSNTVRLSCWTTVGFYVIGDAVRFTQQ